MVWNKGSLTEQQMKRTVTILIETTYKTNSRMRGATLTVQCPVRSSATIAWPAPPLRTEHDVSWYQISRFVWPVWVSLPSCVTSWLLVKINPVLVKPRTQVLRCLFFFMSFYLEHDTYSAYPSLSESMSHILYQRWARKTYCNSFNLVKKHSYFPLVCFLMPWMSSWLCNI